MSDAIESIREILRQDVVSTTDLLCMRSPKLEIFAPVSIDPAEAVFRMIAEGGEEWTVYVFPTESSAPRPMRADSLLTVALPTPVHVAEEPDAIGSFLAKCDPYDGLLLVGSPSLTFCCRVCFRDEQELRWFLRETRAGRDVYVLLYRGTSGHAPGWGTKVTPFAVFRYDFTDEKEPVKPSLRDLLSRDEDGLRVTVFRQGRDPILADHRKALGDDAEGLIRLAVKDAGPGIYNVRLTKHHGEQRSGISHEGSTLVVPPYFVLATSPLDALPEAEPEPPEQEAGPAEEASPTEEAKPEKEPPAEEAKPEETAAAAPPFVTVERRRLPDERRSVTRKITVKFASATDEDSGAPGLSELDLYVTVGLYEDGRPGEIFVKAGKVGSLASGLLDALAIAMSIGLQSGIPAQAYTQKFVNMRFHPSGSTGDPELGLVKSVVDAVARWLDLRFPAAAE